MAVETPCQTPGMDVEIKIQSQGNRVSVTINLPEHVVLTAREALLVDANLHNVIELIFARYFARG